jgi:inorganic pyrophosphatase
MLGNLPVCLAIDGYGPIADNAGGLATMCTLQDRIREITDELDSAGNTTAAMGKGFAIGSACLVAFALFGAFVTRTHIATVNLMTPIIFSGLLFGAMVPFLFSALTMKAVGNAAEDMVQAVRDDFLKNKEKFDDPEFMPDIDKCIGIATNSSLTEMILPGLLVLAIPITAGVLFGPKCVAGLLVGIIISGIQMAISSANSGGAWDNTKKCIKKHGLPVNEIEEKKIKIDELKRRSTKEIVSQDLIQNLEEELKELEKNTNKNKENNIFLKKLNGKTYKAYRKAEKASIVGDTVGDPLKDTSGPSLNILIKLSSIVSVVFGGLFLQTAYLVR